LGYENLRYEVDGPIALVTLAREKALNALNRHTLNELLWVLRDADGDERVRAVILTGAGDKAFVAGADIAEMEGLSALEARRFAEAGHAVGDLIAQMQKPVIAAVNGFALGGGCELALACDFVYASTSARFGQPEVNLGLMCGFGGTQRLARRVGSARAMELVLTGEPVDAQEAHRLGLVNVVCPPAELLDRARACAKKIADKAPLAVASSKRAVRRAEELPLAAGNELERELFSLLFTTDDRKEGLRAFLEKRSPKFLGR
jgi:enoyl-CoA hydratase